MSDKQPSYEEVKKAQTFYGDAIELCMKGDLDSLQKLIQKFISYNSQYNLSDILQNFQSEGKTFLHVAASSGHKNIFDFVFTYCKSDESVNSVDINGFTPLMNAVISENDEIIQTLLKHNAKVNVTNKDGAAAIHFASADGSIPRLQLLLSHQADPTILSQAGNALHWAAGKGRIEVIKYLIEEYHISIDILSPTGLPAVIMAAVSRCDEGVKYLVDKGANVGYIITGNLTLLHICSENGLYHAVSSILQTSTGIKCCHIQTNDGNTPIHLAAMSKDIKMIQLLLSYSKDIYPSTMTIEDILKDGEIRMNQWMQAHESSLPHEMRNTINKNDNSINTTSSSNHTNVNNTSSSGSNSSSSGNSNNDNNESSNNSTSLPPPATSPYDIQSLYDSLQPVSNEENKMKSNQYKNEGNQYYIHKQYIEAIYCYNQAIEYNNRNEMIWSNRSACYLSLNYKYEALRDAEISRRLNPIWIKSCYRLASARLALELYEDAALAAFEGCKIDQNNKELKEMLQKAVALGREQYEKKITNEKKKEEEKTNNEKISGISHNTRLIE